MHATFILCSVTCYELREQMRNKEIENIKEDIEKSGLPLEIDVNGVLKKRGWNVSNQRYYLDQTEKKARYIDIFATKLVEIKSPKLDKLNITLVIECKRSLDKPWVFYTVPKGEMHQPTLGQVFLIKFNSQPKLPYPEYKLFWHSHYFLRDISKIAIRSYVAFTGGKNGINRAINQSLKALTYHRNEVNRLLPKISRSLDRYSIIMIYYPVVVLDGEMYECEKSNNDLKLSKAEYEQYQVHYGISESSREETYLVDIVKKDFLHKYLTWLDDEISLISTELKM